MVRGSSGRVRVPRHLANGRARQQVSNLFSSRAKQELYTVTPPLVFPAKAHRKHAYVTSVGFARKEFEIAHEEKSRMMSLALTRRLETKANVNRTEIKYEIYTFAQPCNI